MDDKANKEDGGASEGCCRLLFESIPLPLILFEPDSLAIARVVRRHGGRVWAQDNTARGATFYFTLSGRRTGAALTTPPTGLSAKT